MKRWGRSSNSTRSAPSANFVALASEFRKLQREFAAAKKQLEQHDAWWQVARGGIQDVADTRIRRDTGELHVRSRLHDLLVEFFKEDDLKEACFDLGVDFESLPGDGKQARARALVEHMEQRGDLYKLVGWCRQQRPKIDWSGFG